MKRSFYFALFAAGLVFSLFAALFQRAPGYMDADYYYMGGRNLAAGEGFTEHVLWNYLDDPAGLPHPSHAYWMPLASIVAAAGLALAPGGGFDAAQWGFILLAALVPPLTAALAARLYADRLPGPRRRATLLAGLLALFPGYYFGFLTTTDSFGLYMVLGALFFLLLASDWDAPFLKAMFLGMLAGLMHLARADGFLWLLLAPAVSWHRDAKRAGGSAAGGYFLVMAAWLVRNQIVFGSPLAPGGVRGLWLTGYDELFTYPPQLLTFQHWLASGWQAILTARLEAAWQNLLSALAVNGLVFLFPLMLAGLWQLRDRRVFRVGAAGWGLAFLLMSAVFPFAGARGGFFHAAAAVQPLLWAAVPAGLAAFVDWGRHARGWQPGPANQVFGLGLVLLALFVTGFLGWVRVVGPGLRGGEPLGYAESGEFLADLGVSQDAIVMVNNPPGFYNETGRPAIVIPDGGLEPVLAAGARYGAEILLLGPEQGLTEFYDAPDEQTGLEYLGSAGELRVFRFVQNP